MKNRLEVVMYDDGGRQVERKVNAINRALVANALGPNFTISQNKLGFR